MIQRNTETASAAEKSGVTQFVSGDYIRPVSGMQYYVLMKDYGGKIGFGADVAPEYSRRQIVQEVCDEIGKGRCIIHVKHIDGNDLEDVTHEIVAEALAIKAEQEAELVAIDALNDRIQARRDRNQDYRKHSEAAE